MISRMAHQHRSLSVVLAAAVVVCCNLIRYYCVVLVECDFGSNLFSCTDCML